jgi:hypothetical protein
MPGARCRMPEPLPWAERGPVAQTAGRRIAGFQPAGTGQAAGRCRLEVGGTAGWKPALRTLRRGAVGVTRDTRTTRSWVGGRLPTRPARRAEG